jgi:hypothetical protein
MTDRRGRRGTIRLVPLALAALAVCEGAAAVVPEGPAGGAQGARQAEDGGWSAGPALGYDGDAELLAALDVGAEPGLAVPPTARLTARWSEVERAPGTYDWSSLARAVDALSAAGHRVVLCLTGPHPTHLPSGGVPSPLEGDSLAAWIEFARTAVRELGDGIAAYQVWDRVGGETPVTARDYAFLLKNTALALRAEARARGSRAGIVQAAVGAGTLEWQQRLWELDVAAYIDVLPLDVPVATRRAELVTALRELQAENLRHPPAAALWVRVAGRRGAGRWDGTALAVTALAAGAATALVEIGPEHGADTARWLAGAHGLLDRGGFAAAPEGTLRLETPDGAALPQGRVLGRFFSEADFSTLILYDAPGPASELPTDRLVVDTSFVRNARVVDPVDGSERRVPSAPLEEGARGRSVRISRAGRPLGLVFEQGASSPGFALDPEEARSERRRELTAEEVIARYQQVQKYQDDRLERWTARGRTELHLVLTRGGASTVDVGIESNYFWERGRELEWEQTDYSFNGNAVRWKKIPQLPQLQVEKVVTVPLDLSLDRTYAYRLVGSGRVDGRESYVLAFEPLESDTTLSLYRGRVWIDRETFVRLKMEVVQSNLEAPVISNEEVSRYAPFVGPDGMEYWLLASTDSQQIWKTMGRNFVVRRQLTFSDLQVNPDRRRFEERRAAAYASSHTMLRDTAEGFRYLDREPDGTRTVRDEFKSRQLFAAAGALKDQSTDGVVPLAGFNYFNYNFRGRDLQVNALFAGVLGFFTVSDPNLFGSRNDATLDTFLIGIKTEDRVFVGDQEIETELLEQRNQNLLGQVGFPLGSFFRINLVGGVTFRRYFDSDDAAAAIDAYNEQNAGQALTFIRPVDHEEYTVGVGAEFNRFGWNLRADGALFSRSEWKAWGMFDGTGQTFVALDPATGLYEPAAASDVFDEFSRWRVTGFKEWYLRGFQKLRAEINYLDGRDLDRFSRYNFSLFGDTRLNGFSGSGVRFDRGWIGRAGYSFNAFEAVQLNAVLETARIENDENGPGYQSHTGFGFSGNVPGPWTTVWSLSYGLAVDSDIEELKGEQEFLLLVFKLF